MAPDMPEQTDIRPPLWREIGETVRLAGPAIVARAGMLLMSIATLKSVLDRPESPDAV